MGLWALVASLAGTIYPALVQRFRAEPQNPTKEAPYIERNIEMTRLYGSSRCDPRNFDYEPTLTAKEIEEMATVRNVRLLDPAVMRDTFQHPRHQELYDFRDIDVDRYEIDGRTTQVVLAARELKQTDLPNNSWESEHIAFTHGYGIAAAPASDRCKRATGLRISDIPVAARLALKLDVDLPGLYVGEGLKGMPLLAPHGRSTFKITMIGPKSPAMTELTESTSIRCLESSRLLSVSLNLVVSGELGSDSRILYKRTYWTEPFSPHSSSLTGTPTLQSLTAK